MEGGTDYYMSTRPDIWVKNDKTTMEHNLYRIVDQQTTNVMRNSLKKGAVHVQYPVVNHNNNNVISTPNRYPSLGKKCEVQVTQRMETPPVIRKALKQALLYQDGTLVSGSLDALIQHLVPTSKYYPDRTYIFAFLLSSRLFIRPYSLMSEICQVCTFQQNLSSDKCSKETLGKFGPHLIQLLSEWTEMFPYDFRDERMMHHLKELTQRIVSIYPDLRKDVGILMHNLLSKLSGLQKYEELLQRINQEVAQRLINIMPTTDIYEVCPSPLCLAQQLTHIELERLSMIGPEEFVQAFAKDNDKEPAYKDMKKTNNLEAYVQWFNRLSYFVATEICMHLKKKKVPTATLR